MRNPLLISVVCALALLIGCNELCDNEAPAEHPSPDGQWKYVSFDRNCGATTESNLQISVLQSSQSLPNEAANAFIADGNHGATTFVAQPEWIGSHTLRITYSSKASVSKKESHVGPVRIEYAIDQ